MMYRATCLLLLLLGGCYSKPATKDRCAEFCSDFGLEVSRFYVTRSTWDGSYIPHCECSPFLPSCSK